MALKGPRDLSSDALREKIKEMGDEIARDTARICIDMTNAEHTRIVKLNDMRRAVISECEAELKRRDEQ